MTPDPGSILGPDPKTATAAGPWRSGAWFQGPPRGRFGLPAALIWLAFIVFPLVDAITNRGPVVGHVLVIAGAAVFVAGYVWLVVRAFGRQMLAAQAVCAGLAAIAVVLTVFDRAGWGFLFTYCAACTAVVAPPRHVFPTVIGLTALAATCCAIGGGGAGGAFGYGASTIGIGLLMVLMRDLRVRNGELLEARAELARTAVAQERERFARDLHDLLGHSLSVIALKAELAGKLIPASPERAAQEVGEVEAVARQALGEVRLAVSGYQPTLDGELQGARLALSAAGIEADVVRPSVTLAPEVEAVLAWAVREGATNVIRHSSAHRCTLRVIAGVAEASVEIIDDGTGGSPINGHRGNGLAGLGERAAALQGWVEAGAGPDGGGFRLAVCVPVAGGAGGVSGGAGGVSGGGGGVAGDAGGVAGDAGGVSGGARGVAGGGG